MTEYYLPDGIILKDDALAAPDLQRYALQKGLIDVRIFVAFEGLKHIDDLKSVHNVKRSYVIYKGTMPVFESQQLEAIAVHIDVMALQEQFDGFS